MSSNVGRVTARLGTSPPNRAASSPTTAVGESVSCDRGSPSSVQLTLVLPVCLPPSSWGWSNATSRPRLMTPTMSARASASSR